MGPVPCNEVKTFTIIPQDLPPKIIEDISYQHLKKIKLLGQGAFGKVYLVRSKETGKEYALKEIDIEKRRDEWAREVNILKTIDHPNIISFKCGFQSKKNEKIYNIITEYVDNGDLSQLINEKKKKKEYFKEEQLLNWLIQLCLAIYELHEKEIIHRDIKPSNIYLMKDNTIKLGDFGTAKDVSKFHRAKTLIGTPLYIAPEIIEEKIIKNKKKKYDYKVDIWSLGVTFCHLMSLEYPFDIKINESGLYDNILKGIKNKKIMNEKGNYYNDIILDNYSKDFLDIIDEMMTLEPKQRPDIETILKKDIVIKRMKSLLEESKFNEKIADSQIKKYQENEQKILKSIQERLNEQKKQFDEKGDLLVIEDLIKGEDIPSEKKIDEFISKTQNKKIQYNYLRQMSLIQEILKRNNTISNL